LKLFDFEHPYFRPVWVRILVVVICLGWGLLELSTGETFWAVLFLGVGLIAAWQFATIDYDKDADE